jgi:serine/threonine-protein kinase RsbW
LSERALRAHPEASSDAREYVQDRLAKILPPRRLAEAQLLASEVVTNAVRHVRLNPDDIIRFNIEVHPGTVRFSVVDAGEGFDTASVLRKVPSNGRGWGLYLVEKLSNRWGNGTSHPHTVWFEIERSSWHGR